MATWQDNETLKWMLAFVGIHALTVMGVFLFPAWGQGLLGMAIGADLNLLGVKVGTSLSEKKPATE